MGFDKDFNDLLNDLLNSYKAAGSVYAIDVEALKVDHPDIYNNYLIEAPVDTSVGSITFIKAAVLASALWSAYKTLDRVSRQVSVQTADRQYKELHAADYGIPVTGKTDAQIVNDVLEFKRYRGGGGNRYDYIAWAKAVELDGENATHVSVYPLAQGEGTFDIVVVSNQDQGMPSGTLLVAIENRLKELQPVISGLSTGMRVLAPQLVVLSSVEVSGSGENWDIEASEAAITEYVNSLNPGQPLYRSQIAAIAHAYGADSVNVIYPDVDMAPVVHTVSGVYQMYRTDSVSVYVV